MAIIVNKLLSNDNSNDNNSNSSTTDNSKAIDLSKYNVTDSLNKTYNPYQWSATGTNYATQSISEGGSLLTTEIPRGTSLSNKYNIFDNPVSNILDEKFKNALNGTELTQEYIAIPGNIVHVLIEFPGRGLNGNALIFQLDDVVSLSYSVYRAKPTVVLLGGSGVDGFGLGVKTVAGSLVRSVFSHDKFTLVQSAMYNQYQKNMADKTSGKNNKLPTGLPEKELLSCMKDDLTSFNIHCVSITEGINPITQEPYLKTDSIIGCMIINNGQVFSVEDLITEGNFSYQAKGVRSSVGAPDFSEGFSSSPAFKTISQIMGED